MNKKITLLSLLFLVTVGAARAYDKTYAVIVALNDYKYDACIKDLPYSLNNAMGFYNYLTSKEGGSVPSSNICLITDSRASRTNIITLSKAMFANANQNDRVFFYFSGHGGEGCLAPYDYNGYYESTLTYEDVKSIFRSAKCNTKLLFIDACHSGGIKGNPNKVDGNSSFTDNMNIAVMVASKSDEYSYQWSDLQMGGFTYYLIEGLNGAANRDGNKYITIQELFYYVRNKVLARSQELYTEQTPQLFGKFDLRLILAKVYE